MNVYQENGTSLCIPDHSLASGGEGAIYKIQGYPGKLIKIYSDTNDAQSKKNKIDAMVKFSNNRILHDSGLINRISWPLAMIFDDKHNYIGFGMNSIGDGIDLEDVYAYPPQPNADISIRDKINLLISMCETVDKFHSLNFIIGDFNPDNIVVYKNMTVGFIDVDSFHITLNGTLYKCVVCAPGFVAPEIVSKTKYTTYEAYPGTTFTVESDNFGLAIHCFMMLMNGCHPYKCVKNKLAQGSATAVVPIDLRVERGETPFFNNVSNVTTPKWTLRTNDLPDYMVNMFERAFVEGNIDPGNRPNPQEWKYVLERYKNDLTQCRRNHQYWRGLGTCPYCEAEKRDIDPNPQGITPSVNTATSTKSAVKNAVHTTASNVINNLPMNNNYYTISSVSNEKDEMYNKIFWGVTLTIMLCILAGVVYANYNYGFLDVLKGHKWINKGCVWFASLAGFVGTCMYNDNWSSYAQGGRISLIDYFRSLLCGITIFVVGELIALITAYILIQVISICWEFIKFIFELFIAIFAVMLLVSIF